MCRVSLFVGIAVGLAFVGGEPGPCQEAGQAPDDLPLANISVPAGQTPQVQATEEGYEIQNMGRIQAEIRMPPDAYPCRLAAPAHDMDVVQLRIGRVRSLLANAMYSPETDLAVEFLGQRVVLQRAELGYTLSAEGPLKVNVIPNFMKTRRGVRWYRPITQSAFKRAPAGWCSWYIYWQGIDEAEVVKNTDWMAENLKQFGLTFVQIDDGWQGVGYGGGENRDWYVTEPKKFPHGMKWLADYIRSKGFRPGIWLIPFNTSNEETFRARPEMFIRRPDGTSIGEDRDAQGNVTNINWCGRFFIDPTSDAGRQWFLDLFNMVINDWGYEYVKIDGQGGARWAPEAYRDRLANPALEPGEAYRAGLEAIKSVMGPERFLLNCGGQVDSCGYCEGMRTGGDVGPSWSGMQPAIQCTMWGLHLNHIAFWTDPDVVCVRPAGSDGSSLTYDQARVWATLYGITGQLLMASDRMYDLPEDRVELLRRIYPVADIWPMELYPLPGRPRIFDLKVAKDGVGEWDVVAVFNWNDSQHAQVTVRPEDLGLPSGRYLFYDAWEKQLLACERDGLALTLPPTSCRVVVVRAFEDHPQLVGTSRHITQGADDLLEATWDARAMTWSGRSLVVGGDPYELRFTVPPGWALADRAAKQEGPLAVLTLTRPENGEVAWKVAFRRAPGAEAQAAVDNPRASQEGKEIVVTWDGRGAIAYRVYRNGQVIAQVAGTRFTDRPRKRGVAYRYEIAPVGWRGEGERVLAGEITLQPLPRGTAPDVWLDEIEPVTAVQEWGWLHRRQSVDGNPISIGGVVYERGLGTHANGALRYQLDNRYRLFEAWVGVDDEKGGAGTVVFQVWADGEKVFDSGVMRGGEPAKKVSIPLDGVEELELVVTDAGDGITCDHADWADAKLLGNPG
ncbi:MAG: NPCBM/NEW2 domain-containing protein [Armatimonadetes bacterium]|nr:NPCBM/NEW2 domain-containing protein [Armatimonadota bacterium]